MPSKSSKQERFMQAVANDKNFAKKVDVPEAVGKEFSEADKASGEASKKKKKHERMYK